MADWYYFDNDGQKQGPVTGGKIKELVNEGMISPEALVEDPGGRTRQAKDVNGLTFWYYYDRNGYKKGPFSGDQLKELVKQGLVTRETRIENGEGQSGPARKVPRLPFPEMPEPVPPPQPVGPNPFTAPMPASDNPFTAPMPEPDHPFSVPLPKAARTTRQTKPQRVSAPISEETKNIFKRVIILCVMAIVLVVGGYCGLIWWKHLHLTAETQKAINAKMITEMPLEKAKTGDISINWAVKEISAGVASGKFTAKTKTTEKLYHPVDNEKGVKSVTTLTNETEYNNALAKYRSLPVLYQNDLRNAMPKDDLTKLQFYEVREQQGGDVTVTGSVEMTRYGKDWQGKIQNLSLDCGDDLIRESKFLIRESKLPPDAHKIDDPKTEAKVNAIIQNRGQFADKVDTAEKEVEKFMEAVKAAVNEKLIADLLLEITDVSVVWTAKTPHSASVKFTAETSPTEIFYHPVSVKDALKKLGINEFYEKYMPQDKLQFYDVLLSSDDKVTLTGSVTLTGRGNDWKADKISRDSNAPLLGNHVVESKLPDGARKLDDPKTREFVVTGLKAVIQKLLKADFDNYCKPGSRYKGDFRYGAGTFDVEIAFDEIIAQNPKEVRGTITVEYERWNRPPNKLVRPFTVAFNLTEGANPSVTAKIDNTNMLSKRQFIGDIGTPIAEHQQEVSRFYDMLSNNTTMNIQLGGGGMQCSLLDSNDSTVLLNLSSVPRPTPFPPIDLSIEPKPPSNGTPVPPPPPPPVAIRMDDAFFRDKGFETYSFSEPLQNFANFGTAVLKNELRTKLLQKSKMCYNMRVKS